MIYFDNAATGGFKPRAVTDAVENVVRYLCANPGRSAHRLAITGAEIIYNARKEISTLFNCQPERVIFTKNCTEALNVAIFGSLRPKGHIITTVYEHNSVLRPLTSLHNKGLISLDIVAPTSDEDIVQAISDKITPSTYMVITTAVSNVTGENLPIDKIAKLCKQYNLLYLVDGAQAGGHIPIDVNALGISYLALAGHKGLYGIMGSGVLILGEDVDLSPLIHGGTGSESFKLTQPNTYPERLESGTSNLPAIASLNESVRYVKNNMNSFSKLLFNATKELISRLSAFEGIKIYSHPNEAGIVAFDTLNFDCNLVADCLNNDYDIAVRSGFHCAPLMHKFLKTDEKGLIRVSLCVQNTMQELNAFLRALGHIISG